jgi:septum site-determining protein MinC
MSVSTTGSGPLSFEIKSAELSLVALLLKSPHLSDVARDLQHRFGDTPGFFDQDPLLVDLTALKDQAEVPDFPALLALLRQHHLSPVAVKGGNAEHMAAALQAGLAPADDAVLQKTQPVAAPEPAPAPVPTFQPALVVDRPLRSGQQVYARGRDLVVLAMVNPGAEVIADGHIHVYAPLRGKAMAGARGFAEARIFAQALEAELISIAGVYRTSDVPLPDNVRGQPAMVRLQSGPDGDKLILDPVL